MCLQICCSSPERFLRASRDGVLEAKPIKGTARRHADADADMLAAAALAASEKDQAENLMIVDLLRNDLGRICEVVTSLACLFATALARRQLICMATQGFLDRWA